MEQLQISNDDKILLIFGTNKELYNTFKAKETTFKTYMQQKIPEILWLNKVTGSERLLNIIFNLDFINNELRLYLRNVENSISRDVANSLISKLNSILDIHINLFKLLENINIQNEAYKTQFIELLFKYKSNIMVKIQQVSENIKESKSGEWGSLLSDQGSEIFKDIKTKLLECDVEKTIYNLLSLKASILDSNGKNVKNLKIFINASLEGTWEEDKNKITLLALKTNPFGEPGSATTSEQNPFKLKSPRLNLLLLGFGPSAAGKSYMIENLIPHLRKAVSVKKLLPSEFTISVDGEIFRENSIFYTYILLLANLLGKIGYADTDKSGVSLMKKGTNLVRTLSMKKTTANISLLNTTDLKKKFKDYLCNDGGPNKSIFNGNYNIYLPDTLSSSSEFKLGIWTNLNKNKQGLQNSSFVIPMLIFQCLNEKNPPTCKYCKGTYKSGTERSKLSGKKYDPRSYNKSMTNAITALKDEYLKSKSLVRVIIHNSGGKKDDDQNFYKSTLFTDSTELSSVLSSSNDNLFKVNTNEFHKFVEGNREILSDWVKSNKPDTYTMRGGGRKKLTKKKKIHKKSKYNTSFNTQKNKSKIIKNSKTKKGNKLYKRLSKNKSVKKLRTKKKIIKKNKHN